MIYSRLVAMDLRAPRYLFSAVSEYLQFVRHLTLFTRSSPDGEYTASLRKQDGWYYWYRVSVKDGPTLLRHVHRFRATPQRLAQFHIGCDRVIKDLEQYLQSRDRRLLHRSNAFGELDGDLTDKPDSDEWMDRVECAELLEILQRVEGHEQRGDEAAAWNELRSVPAEHEYHVEVLRRRLLFCYYVGFTDHVIMTRWARALVELEPYDAINWTNLEYAVAGPDGEEHESAIKVLREAVGRHGPNFILYYNLASRLCSLNRIDEAREGMRLALDEDPYAITSALESVCFAPIWEFLLDIQASRNK